MDINNLNPIQQAIFNNLYNSQERKYINDIPTYSDYDTSNSIAEAYGARNKIYQDKMQNLQNINQLIENRSNQETIDQIGKIRDKLAYEVNLRRNKRAEQEAYNERLMDTADSLDLLGFDEDTVSPYLEPTLPVSDHETLYNSITDRINTFNEMANRAKQGNSSFSNKDVKTLVNAIVGGMNDVKRDEEEQLYRNILYSNSIDEDALRLATDKSVDELKELFTSGLLSAEDKQKISAVVNPARFRVDQEDNIKAITEPKQVSLFDEASNNISKKGDDILTKEYLNLRDPIDYSIEDNENARGFINRNRTSEYNKIKSNLNKQDVSLVDNYYSEAIDQNGLVDLLTPEYAIQGNKTIGFRSQYQHSSTDNKLYMGLMGILGNRPRALAYFKASQDILAAVDRGYIKITDKETADMVGRIKSIAPALELAARGTDRNAINYAVDKTMSNLGYNAYTNKASAFEQSQASKIKSNNENNKAIAKLYSDPVTYGLDGFFYNFPTEERVRMNNWARAMVSYLPEFRDPKTSKVAMLCLMKTLTNNSFYKLKNEAGEVSKAKNTDDFDSITSKSDLFNTYAKEFNDAMQNHLYGVITTKDLINEAKKINSRKPSTGNSVNIHVSSSPFNAVGNIPVVNSMFGLDGASTF